MKKSFLAVLVMVSVVFSFNALCFAYSGEEPSLEPLTRQEKQVLFIDLCAKLRGRWTTVGVKFMQDIDPAGIHSMSAKQTERFFKRVRHEALIRVSVFKTFLENKNDAILARGCEIWLNAQEKVCERRYGFNVFKTFSVLKAQEKAFLAGITSVNRIKKVNPAW